MKETAEKFIKEKIKYIVKFTKLTMTQLVFIVYLVLKRYHGGVYLTDIKVMFNDIFKGSKLKNFLIWILNFISNIGSEVFTLGFLTVCFLIIIISFLGSNKYETSSNPNSFKISHVLFEFALKMLKATFYLFTVIWIYYILALELKTTSYVHLEDFNELILILNIIIILVSLFNRIRYGIDKEFKDNDPFYSSLNNELKKEFQPVNEYIPVGFYCIDKNTSIYFIIERCSNKGICFKATSGMNKNAPIPMPKYNITILYKSNNLEFVEKYFNYLVTQYKSQEK